MTIQEVKSCMWHPSGSRLAICFTNWGLLFWMFVDKGMDKAVECKFSMVDKVLIHFREKFDSRRLQVVELQSECHAGSVSSQVLS